MDPVALTVGISWTLGGLLCIGLSLPLIYGRVGPNAFYGVRVPGAFDSDEAWYAINRFGGKRLAWWSIPSIMVGLIAFFLPLQARPTLAIIVSLVPAVFIWIAVLQTVFFARRYRAVGELD